MPLKNQVLSNPGRGILRIRRASDLALTALFGLAMVFDLLGNGYCSYTEGYCKPVLSRRCYLDERRSIQHLNLDSMKGMKPEAKPQINHWYIRSA